MVKKERIMIRVLAKVIADHFPEFVAALMDELAKNRLSYCDMCEEEVVKGNPMCENCYRWVRGI